MDSTTQPAHLHDVASALAATLNATGGAWTDAQAFGVAGAWVSCAPAPLASEADGRTPFLVVDDGADHLLARFAAHTDARVLEAADWTTPCVARLDTGALPGAPTSSQASLLIPFDADELPDGWVSQTRARYAMVAPAPDAGHLLVRWSEAHTTTHLAATLDAAVAGRWRIEGAPVTPDAALFTRAIRTTAEALDAPDSGLAQLTALEQEIASWRALPGLHGELAFALLYHQITARDGAMGRALYRDFLRAAASELPALRDLATNLARTVQTWGSLARFARASAQHLSGVPVGDDDPFHHAASMASAVLLFEETFWERALRL